MKKQRSVIGFLSWLSLGLIFMAVVLAGFQLVSYSRMRSKYPLNLMIANVPCGGLNSTEAAERLTRAYGIPIELDYGGARIQVSPSSVGFSLNLEAMLAEADRQRVLRGFWQDFWSYLWNRLPSPTDVNISYSISEERLVAYLESEIIPRYDTPAKAPVPVQGTVGFSQGEKGQQLIVKETVNLMKTALEQTTAQGRKVIVPFDRTEPPRASSISLEYMIRQILQKYKFDGTAEFYILDLERRNEINVAFDNLQRIPTDVAFTAASTIKVPIMIYLFANRDLPLNRMMSDNLSSMIEISENGPADNILQAISGNLAPNFLTDDLKGLGLKNTFLGGLFYIGAPLLQRHETKANSRTDVITDPDRYNQTTAADIGQLFDDLYLCSVYNGGGLKAYYGDRITQEECTYMLDEMSKNKNGVLLEAGVPETTRISHKHGWILEGDGLIHNISDAGIVYTPNATYVFTFYLYHKDQIPFDPANSMMAEISNAVYQYFNQGAN